MGTNYLAYRGGLDRYGYHEDSTRVAQEFSKTVLRQLRARRNHAREYNVVDGSANVKVAAGYKSNVVGFGWTNGVYLKLQDLIAAPPTSPTTTNAR